MTRYICILFSFIYLGPIIAFYGGIEFLQSVRPWEYLLYPGILYWLYVQLNQKNPNSEAPTGSTVVFLCALALCLLIPYSNYLAQKASAFDFSETDSALKQFGKSTALMLFGGLKTWVMGISLPILLFGAFMIWAAIFFLWQLTVSQTKSTLLAFLLCNCFLLSPLTGSLVNKNFSLEIFYPICLFWFFNRIENYTHKMVYFSLWILLSIKEEIGFYILCLGLGCLFVNNKRSLGFGIVIRSLFVILFNFWVIQPFLSFGKSYDYSKIGETLASGNWPLIVFCFSLWGLIKIYQSQPKLQKAICWLVVILPLFGSGYLTFR